MSTKEELKKMSAKELEEELRKTGIDLLKLRFAISGRQSKETSRLKALRKYVARIKTIKRMHETEKVSERGAEGVVTK